MSARTPAFCECGDHAFAALTRGYVALVSPEDVHLLLWKWNARPSGNQVKITHTEPDRTHWVLARAIMRPDADHLVDHRDRNSTDNRRPNLRVCTNAENSRNRVSPKSRGQNLPKGVFKFKKAFRASIKADGVNHYLGSFPTVADAYDAYCAAAERLHGEFARVA